jgi:Tat protein translocase TatB subunit
MPSIGPLEMMMVGVIALIVFGPSRLPEIARSIGKAFAEFKRQANDIRSEFQSGLDADEIEDEKPSVAPGTTDAPGSSDGAEPVEGSGPAEGEKPT